MNEWYVIEFRNGSYFVDILAPRGGAIHEAYLFDSATAAREFMDQHNWIAANGGMVVTRRSALQKVAPDELTPESLRTIGVEVGRWYDAEPSVLSTAVSIEQFENGMGKGFMLKIMQSGGMGISIPLTSLSQARSLLAGLGVVS